MNKEKLKQVDFLMIYEHKVRELENLCLLKCELEKRGYTVKIIHIEDEEALNAVKPIYYAKVVVLMACYRDRTLEWHTKDYVVFDKVIDMQWENIVYPKDEKAASVFKNYSGIGKEVVRVSWGEANRRRLLETAHMKPSNIKVVGHVGMDFLRDSLSGYYLNREGLFKEYQIPTDKKVILFASPFYADNLPESYIVDMCDRFGEDWRDYYAFMMKSETKILEWMKELCKAHDDIVVIYRPHPGHIGEHMKEVAKQCSNFRVISDKSIKQWILTCDIIYTGNSSVIVEAFFANKMCYLLFPYEVTKGFELQLISEGDRITTYEEFVASTKAENKKFPITREKINDIYLVDEKVPSFIKFADMAEEVFEKPEYNLTKEQLKSYRSKKTLSYKMQRAFQRCDFLYGYYQRMLENEKCQNKWIQKQRNIRKQRMEEQKQFIIEKTSDAEIQGIVNRIAEQLHYL